MGGSNPLARSSFFQYEFENFNHGGFEEGKTLTMGEH
jgi:hypothetical protein